MRKRFLTTVSASLLLFGSTACVAPDSDSAPSNPDSAPPAQSELLTYDGPAQNIPVTAQYPDTIEVMGTGSGEGVGVFFTFQPQGNALDDAEVSVFLPANSSDTGDLMDLITGSNGLIENNGWTLDGSRADTAPEFSYPWFEMVFDISTDMEQSGHILIGQAAGQPIQVIVLYPAEMADEFWPAANTVLDSLEFDADRLPITTSE